MSDTAKKPLTLIGRAEPVTFAELDNTTVPARIDSGARTSSIWGETRINEHGQLVVYFFGDRVERTFVDFDRQVVASSTGHVDRRYKIRLSVELKGRKIRASFTIADRSSQVYPVLIGRNVLHGKFLVDVRLGEPRRDVENKRIKELQRQLEEES